MGPSARIAVLRGFSLAQARVVCAGATGPVAFVDGGLVYQTATCHQPGSGGFGESDRVRQVWAT